MSDANHIPALYNLVDELKRFEDLADWITDADDVEKLMARQDEVIELLTKKTDNCVAYARYLEGLEDLVQKRLVEINLVGQRNLKKLESYKNYLRVCLEKLDVNKIEGQMNSISLRAASYSVEVFDESQLPVEFMRTKVTTSPDKQEIARQLKAGHHIPGARLVEGTKSIIFK